MSRGYNARRKARRQQAEGVAEPSRRHRAGSPRRLVPILPILAIAAALAATAILGFGTTRKQVDQEVTALLAGIPQDGNTLGSPQAPVTLQVFADLECPTVKLFAEKYLPPIIDTWVRTGAINLTYQSLKTDTRDEHTFFRQEAAAFAAGRQDRLWNFVLTFVLEQPPKYTNNEIGEFLAGIAAQVPGLQRRQWQDEREDSILLKRVALNVYSAHAKDMRYTPSFSVRFNRSAAEASSQRAVAVRKDFMASLLKDVEALRAEASKDVPTVGVFR